MATPVTIREREAAIERSRKKREQSYRQQSTRETSSNNSNTFIPNVYRPIPAYQPQNVDFSDDVAINNFDWDDWQISRPISVSSAHNISYREIKIDKDNYYIFHGKLHFMSTFFEAPFKLKNHNYPNVETYYEACKLFCLIHYSCSTLVQKARYAAAAKKIASDVMKKYRIPRKVVDEWKLREGAQAVYNATHAKFDQNPDLKKKLLDTGDKFIVQCYEKDSIFGSGCTENELEDWFKKNNGKLIKIPIGVQIQSDKAIKVGNGRNLLGNFCMSIREEFRKMEEDMNSLQTLSLL